MWTTRSWRSATFASARTAWTTGSSSIGPAIASTLLVARREQLMRLDLTFGTEPARGWRLETHPSATDGQQSSRTKWLTAGKA